MLCRVWLKRAKLCCVLCCAPRTEDHCPMLLHELQTAFAKRHLPKPSRLQAMQHCPEPNKGKQREEQSEKHSYTQGHTRSARQTQAEQNLAHVTVTIAN